MRITQIRKDIEEISKPILAELGYVEKGSLGESVKSTEFGSQAILLDCVKDSRVFSISIRVFLRYRNIEKIFESEGVYTVNKLLASESIDMDGYNKESLAGLLNRLISNEGLGFFPKFDSVQKIIQNLTNSDYKTWVTSDKVSLFKVRLAAAVLENNNEALALVKEEAIKYCGKPWSEPDREIVKGLCECV
jgi:hypothetical protein